MRHFKIRKGESPSRRRAPSQTIAGPVLATSAAILGTDFPGLRPRFAVAKGDRVGVGQVLFHDRRHPEIAFVSPIAGRVSALDHGPRRTLSAVVVDARDDQAASGSLDVLDLNPDSARQALLAGGHWPAFRTRPFGRVPKPDARPAAIVVNAVHADPCAPDPAVVLAAQADEFGLGLRCLQGLTDGQVFVGQSPGDPLVAEAGRVSCVAFSGTLAAGLASTQIDRLCPAATHAEVWTIGYQDVAAIGHLFQGGGYRAERVISISGPNVSQPRLLRGVLGQRLADIAEDGAGVALSGGASTGRRAAFLGRFDDQVTQVPDGPDRSGLRWIAGLGGRTDAVIPNRRLEQALAVDIPAVPLLRALAIGDSDEAARLGCMSLVEEDMAALSHRCTSGADYPRLLRQVLDVLEKDAA